MRDEIQELSDELVKEMRRDFPADLEEKTVRCLVGILVGLMIQDPSLDHEEGPLRAQQIIKARASAGEAEAVAALEDIVLVTYTPAYQKAVKAGVDPVAVLRADTGCTEEEAVAAVQVIESKAVRS